MDAVLIPFPPEQSRNLKPLNFSPADVHGGILKSPPPSVAFNSHSHRHRQKPPLLPLPRRPLPPPVAGAQPSFRSKGVRSRDQSLTPKKQKPNKRISVLPVVKPPAELVIVDSTNRLGPEPNHVPKDLWKGLGLRSPAPPCEGRRNLEMEFSGSAFTVSPPPSSLPLPNFPLMRKLNCNVEAVAGVDVRATVNLRRLLRLR